jgi:Tripartite tricarboxylate transporter TctB family
MGSFIRNPKDFWTGVLYVAFGVAAIWIGRNYSFGTAGRMGPGYFPNVLGGLLLIIGGVALVRSFIEPGEGIGAIAWKPLFLVLLATFLFGVLINTAGLLVALPALVLVSAAASQKFRFEWGASAGLVGLLAFCSLVFVKGLGVPMPLVGPWLEPYLGWLGR